jgi:ketosteroid isomerase-like protein
MPLQVRRPSTLRASISARALRGVVAAPTQPRDAVLAMSQENVDTIRRMYERWLQDDSSLFDAFDPEIELHPDPAADWVGVNDIYRGHDGVRRYMAQVYEAFEDYHPEVERLLDAGDKVITLAIEHGRGRGSGATVEARRTAHVWTMRANKAIRVDLYLDRSEALDAAGL